jgi:hypothetical protein
MCNIFNIAINPKTTEQTVAKAFAKAESESVNFSFRSEEPGYLGDDRNVIFFMNNTKTGGNYIVETHEIFSEAIFCTCPAFEHDFFCKHCAHVMEEMRIREMEAVYSSIDGNVPEYKF